MARQDLTTEDGMLAYLRSDQCPGCTNVTNVERLPEGSASFVYCTYIENSEWKNIGASIIVKHVEGYLARRQEWKLDQNRMVQCSH